MSEITEKIKEIKLSFRQVMNGVTSKSMREKGATYKLNWGVSVIDLQKMASMYEKDYELSQALWKEDIRECKILATILMPYNEMLEDVADIWCDQIKTQEMAEITSFNLFRHLAYAPSMSYRWIASDNEIKQMCGYNILARLFMDGKSPNERGINEFIDQAICAIQSNNIALRRSAMTALNRFSDLGLMYERLVTSALKTVEANG